MKACEDCGTEIYTTDGDNTCTACDERERETTKKKARRKAQRRARDQIMRDMGLVKVRGALGGTYYE